MAVVSVWFSVTIAIGFSKTPMANDPQTWRLQVRGARAPAGGLRIGRAKAWFSLEYLFRLCLRMMREPGSLWVVSKYNLRRLFPFWFRLNPLRNRYSEKAYPRIGLFMEPGSRNPHRGQEAFTWEGCMADIGISFRCS